MKYTVPTPVPSRAVTSAITKALVAAKKRPASLIDQLRVTTMFRPNAAIAATATPSRFATP
jgi:hypothetical protein